MPRLCEGRVVLITGAGGGVGRGYALEFARHGAKVVVNDLGGNTDGTGAGLAAADKVVAEIKAMGGEAVANYGNVAKWDDGAAMVKQAVDAFGDLHAVICNAGVLRDRTLVNMTEVEWDTISTVHLKGTFVVSRHAAAYWRDQAKKGARIPRALLTTSSVNGLFGAYGQTNYSPAKAHLAMMAQVMAAELERFGVTVNAICPSGATRMTNPLAPKRVVEAQMKRINAGLFDPNDPGNVAATAVYLCSAEAKDITGRVFMVEQNYKVKGGGTDVVLCEPYTRGPTATSRGEKFDTTKMGGVLRGLVGKATVQGFAQRYAEQQAALAARAAKKKQAKL